MDNQGAQMKMSRCVAGLSGALTVAIVAGTGGARAHVVSTNGAAHSESDPAAHALAHVQSGESAAAHGNWQTACREFLAATEIDAKNIVAFYDLGVAQAHLSNLAEAADAERQAVALDEKYTVA